MYREIKLDAGYRLDLLVEDLVIVEVKAVDSLAAIHQAKIISYLSLAGKSSESSLISTAFICATALDALFMDFEISGFLSVLCGEKSGKPTTGLEGSLT